MLSNMVKNVQFISSALIALVLLLALPYSYSLQQNEEGSWQKQIALSIQAKESGNPFISKMRLYQSAGAIPFFNATQGMNFHYLKASDYSGMKSSKRLAFGQPLPDQYHGKRGLNFKNVDVVYSHNLQEERFEMGNFFFISTPLSSQSEKMALKRNYSIIPDSMWEHTIFLSPDQFDNGAGFPDFIGDLNGWSLKKIKDLVDRRVPLTFVWHDFYTNRFDVFVKYGVTLDEDGKKGIIKGLYTVTDENGTVVYSGERFMLLKDKVASSQNDEMPSILSFYMLPGWEYVFQSAPATITLYGFYVENLPNLNGGPSEFSEAVGLLLDELNNRGVYPEFLLLGYSPGEDTHKVLLHFAVMRDKNGNNEILPAAFGYGVSEEEIFLQSPPSGFYLFSYAKSKFDGSPFRVSSVLSGLHYGLNLEGGGDNIIVASEPLPPDASKKIKAAEAKAKDDFA
jgi:hypothetical protein